MDTNKDSAVSDVPTFKVARVGKDRKKKGAGFSFLRGSGARGGWSGATGGAGAGAGVFGGAGGAGGFFASNFVKTMLAIMLASGLGSAAIYLGAMSTREDAAPAKKQALFTEKDPVKLEGDTSNLPGNTNTIPNSLGYLSGSMDGMTAEERAKKAAEAAEAQRLADEEAKKKAEEDAKLAGKPAVDPNALLASAKADGGNKGPGLGKKFGSLSSSFGGGGSSLSGGAGLSGGVGRGFAGAGGSIGKGSSGKLSGASTAARPTFAKAGSSKAAASNAKGFARKQLANANAFSRKAATAGKGETAAYDAATAFDNNQGAGSVISGPGIGKGSGSHEVSDGSVNPRGNDGPMGGDQTPTSCGSGTVADPSTGTCVPPKGNMKDDSKYDWMYKTAEALMLTLTILSGIAVMSHAVDAYFDAGEAIRGVIRVAMGIIGGILTALGVAMMALTGDKIAGGIIAAVGAFTIYGCVKPEGNTGSYTKDLALKIFVPNIIGGFASSMAHKPAAASQ